MSPTSVVDLSTGCTPLTAGPSDRPVDDTRSFPATKAMTFQVNDSCEPAPRVLVTCWPTVGGTSQVRPSGEPQFVFNQPAASSIPASAAAIAWPFATVVPAGLICAMSAAVAVPS